MKLFSKIILIFFMASFIPLFVFCLFFVLNYGLEAVAKQLWQDFLLSSIIISFVFISSFVLIGVFVSRSITYSLGSLVKGTREVAKGNFDVKFDIKSKDELGKLSSTLNEMTVKLKEQQERELLMAQLRTEFTSITAHQLRTPLSLTKWTLRMVLDGDLGALSSEQQDFLEKSYSANERMIHLVNDLLDVSRVEEGRFGFDFKKHDLVDLVEELVDSHKQDAIRRKIDLSFVVPQLPSPKMVVMDPDRLHMAISNLLDNAIRYTDPGGQVRVSVEEKLSSGAGEKDFVQVSVKDNGVGIPEKQKHRVFTKFFRADNVIKKQVGGTGLGLYLTKNIIEKHGGKIWFSSEGGSASGGESKINKGTTFYFTLPLNDAKL